MGESLDKNQNHQGSIGLSCCFSSKQKQRECTGFSPLWPDK